MRTPGRWLNRRARTAALGGLCLAALASAVAVSAAEGRAHKTQIVRWGSSLSGQPVAAIGGVYQADAEFWQTAVAGGRPAGRVRLTAAAPVSGKITSVTLKVGDDSDPVSIRFSVVKPLSGGRSEVLTTSTPAFTLPAHSPGIHVFSFSRLTYGDMPINKGDYLTLDTPGLQPSAMVWYAQVPGSVTDSFTSRGPTQSPGYIRGGTANPGVELLMQVSERPGRPYHFHVG